MTELTDRAAITGIGQTRYAKNLGRTELDLAGEAIRAACADAGLPLREIDGVVKYNVEQVQPWELQHTLGIEHVTFAADTVSGGGGLASTVVLAAMAVATGHARHVVCFRARNRSKGAAYGAGQNQGGRPWEKHGTRLFGADQFHHPFGVASPAQEIALVARRHMHVYGTRAEHFGMQAVAQRAHAAANPDAIMRKAVTLDDWRECRAIAEPIRLFDCSLENDGAVAVVVSAPEAARDLRHAPAWVLAGELGEHPIHVQLSDYFRATGAFGDRDTGAVRIGRRLFAAAGIAPSDVDTAMIFDHFTPAVIMALEQYGFCAMGEGGPYVESGATRWPDGSMPVNTHGGSNGEAFIHGFNHLPEAVRQLRGTAANQVADAEIAFVCGAITDTSGAVLLHR